MVAMRICRTIILLVLGALVLFASGFSSRLLANGDQEDHAQFYEVIGAQRTAANRIGKSVCFLLLGADPGLQIASAEEAIKTFEDGLEELMRNNAAAQQQSKAVLAELDRIADPFTVSARQIMAGDLHQVVMRLFLSNGPKIEQEIAALTALTLENMDNLKEAGAAVAVVHAQAALLQGLLRDACLLRAGLIDAEGAEQMRQDIARFEAQMKSLQQGDKSAGIPPPASIKVRVTLQKIDKFWARLKPTINAVLVGEDVALKQLQKSSIFSDLIEKSLKKMPGYYWKS